MAILFLFLSLSAFFPHTGEKEILEDLLWRCDNLEKIGEITDIVERYCLDYWIPLRPPVFQPYRISSSYGWRVDPITRKYRFHSGIDLAAELASTVHATADGKVIYAGRNGGYGKCIIIRHSYGFVSLYGHLSAYYVLEGEKVKAGKVIGFVGSSGRSTGNHLHYEVRKNNKPIKPYIRKRGITL